MGKVVATVGVIVGAVALAATGIGAIAAPALAGAVSIGGVSASTLLFAGAALQAVGQALIKRPKLSGSTTDRLNASLVTDTPRKMAFGRTALNTDLRYQEWWGRDQEYCSQVFVVASHWCESIDEIWLDDKLAWSAVGGVTREFAGYLGVVPYAQAVPTSVFRAGWSGRWGANATFAGCATLYLQFKVTGNGKKGKSPFLSTITSRVTVVGKGARLPDPRFDSTLGGTGAVRLADQATWAWAPNGHESGRNPALALLFYLIGWRIQNPVTGEWKLAVGRGVPIDRIDIESFITAANLCDEPVTRASGGTEPRYRCDGTFSEEDDPAQVIAGFEACMNGKLRDSTGRFALQVLHNDLATPVVDFTDDDVLGDFNWSAGNNLNDRRNVVRGRLTDPASLYQLVDFPAVRIASVDGIERIDSVDLALVQSPSQGQRIAKQRLQRAQYQGAFSAEFNARGWAVKDGDIVRLTFSALGFDKKLFRVSEGVIDPTGVVPLVLVEEHQAIYAWDRDERAAVQAAEPNTFDPLLLPIIVAIDEAGQTAEWPAIVGEGKPDDYATNGADPDSPFGDGTVGGAIEAIAAAKARAEKIENETIPAVEKAVADAGIAIVAARDEAAQAVAGANKKIDDASAALAEDNAAIVRQVETIATDFHDRDVATNVRVDGKVALLADADKALGERLDQIVSESLYDDTAVRAEISRVDRTAIDRDSATGRRIDEVQAGFTSGGGNWIGNTEFVTTDGWGENYNIPRPNYGINTAGAPYHPVGENVLSIYQGGRTGGDEYYADWISDPVAVEPGTFVQFSAMFASHRADTRAFLAWVGTDGVIFAFVNGNYNSSTENFANDPDLYRRSGVVAVEVPARAVAARLLMRKGDTYAGQGDSYAWFWRPYLGAARMGQTSWNNWSPGTGRAVQIRSDAAIKEVATSAADANRSVAELSTSVTTRFEGVNSTFGGYDERITALSDAQQGFASRTTGLEASAAAASGTLNPNPDFAAWSNPAGGPDLWFGYVNVPVGSFARFANPLGKGGFALDHTPAGIESGFYTPSLFIGNGWYVMEATAWLIRGTWAGAGVTLDGVVSIDFLVDPDSAERTGQSNGDGGVRTWSKLFRVADDYIGPGYKNFHLMGNWSGFSRGFNDKTIRWLRCSLRPASDAEVRAMKADAALPGIAARIKTNEDVLADLPNRFAAASRADVIEAQVNGFQDSGLNRALSARIEERASAIADAKAGAVAQTVQTLRSEYSGTAATVTQQASTLVDLQGRTAAYWRTTAVAGNNRAQITVSADANAGAGVDIVGDVNIRGDLLVDGTIMTAKVGDRQITNALSMTGESQFVTDTDYHLIAGGTFAVRDGARVIFTLNAQFGIDGRSASSSAQIGVQLLIDGNVVEGVAWSQNRGTESPPAQITRLFTGLAAGSHTFSARARFTVTAPDGHRISYPVMIIQESAK